MLAAGDFAANPMAAMLAAALRLAALHLLASFRGARTFLGLFAALDRLTSLRGFAAGWRTTLAKQTSLGAVGQNRQGGRNQRG